MMGPFAGSLLYAGMCKDWVARKTNGFGLDLEYFDVMFANIEASVRATEKEQAHSFSLSKMLHFKSVTEPGR